jgi:hypothetical protein
MQSWATRDVANKKAELAETEVEMLRRQLQVRKKQARVNVIGIVTTTVFLGVTSYDDLLCVSGSMLSEFLGKWSPSWDWCHTGG